MTPVDKGRHCAQCCKTVIDFSGWEAQEILYYLKAHQQDQVCGRFRNEQLNVPIPTPETFVWHISQAPLSAIKKIAAIFLFVFGLMSTSCNTEQTQQAKPIAPTQQTTPVDTTDQTIMGGIGVGTPPPPDSTTPLCIFVPPIIVKEPDYLKGDVIDDPAYMDHTGGAPVVTEVPVIPAVDTTMAAESTAPAPIPDAATETLGKVKVSK
jgi:hypothetical protein